MAATATAAGLALVQSSSNTATLNTEIVQKSTKTLTVQEQLNLPLQGGILMLQQQTDLMDEKIDIIQLNQRMHCNPKYLYVCQTMIPVKNITIA